MVPHKGPPLCVLSLYHLHVGTDRIWWALHHGPFRLEAAYLRATTKLETYSPSLAALPRQRALGAKRYTSALDDAPTIAYGLR